MFHMMHLDSTGAGIHLLQSQSEREMAISRGDDCCSPVARVHRVVPIRLGHVVKAEPDHEPLWKKRAQVSPGNSGYVVPSEAKENPTDFGHQCPKHEGDEVNAGGIDRLHSK